MADDGPRRDKPGFSMRMIDPAAFRENRLELPPEGWAWLNTTPEKFKAHQARMIERERRVPALGAPAPDFAIERLSPEGRRTGETFRLSATRGGPVALVFGSYT